MYITDTRLFHWLEVMSANQLHPITNSDASSVEHGNMGLIFYEGPRIIF